MLCPYWILNHITLGRSLCIKIKDEEVGRHTRPT